MSENQDPEDPQEPTRAEELATEIIETLSKRYRPAADIQDAEIFLSTQEIYNEVISHCPLPLITEELVYRLLKELEFKYDVIEGTSKFVWLMKSRV